MAPNVHEIIVSGIPPAHALMLTKTSPFVVLATLTWHPDSIVLHIPLCCAGKEFDELDSDEKMSVGGTIGGRRGGELYTTYACAQMYKYNAQQYILGCTCTGICAWAFVVLPCHAILCRVLHTSVVSMHKHCLVDDFRGLHGE